MRAEIHDFDALKAITPAAISAFVRSNGWRRTESFGEYSDVYVNDNKAEIIVPAFAATRACAKC